jgi:hypothetical protein
MNVTRIGEREVSPGWHFEISRVFESPHGDRTEEITNFEWVCELVLVFLDIDPATVGPLDWDKLVFDAREPEDKAAEDSTPMWEIPLTINRLAELAMNSGFMKVLFEHKGTKYQFETDVDW